MVVTTRGLVLWTLLLAGGAGATTLLSLDVPSLARGSAAVVRGTVRSSAARWTADHARIVTDTVVDVSEAWKGQPGRQLVVMQPGGEVGDVGQQVHGAVRFTPGEEVVLFLEARGDRYLLTGMVQGRFLVSRSSDGKAQYAHQVLDTHALFLDPSTRQPLSPPEVSLPLETLKAQVLAADEPAPAPRPTSPAQVTP